MRVQRMACHSLSNLGMSSTNASFIVQQGGFPLIKDALQRFCFDEKLCWVGCSALWNLSRPTANREVIGAEGVQLMFKVLKTHSNNVDVLNTAIGALSNLSLNDTLKDLVAQPENLSILLKIVHEAVAAESFLVSTSAAGLLANLAVSDVYANTLVEQGALKSILQIVALALLPSAEDTLKRNICAALNNVVTASSYIPEFLRVKGVEVVYQLLEQNGTEDLYAQLLQNCLQTVDTNFAFEVETRDEEAEENEARTNERRFKKTTSFCLAAHHGQFEIMRELVLADPSLDLNATDDYGMTALDYATVQDHDAIVEFLAKCGVRKTRQYTMSINSMLASSEDSESESVCKIEDAFQKGREVLINVRSEHAESIGEAQDDLPRELAGLISSFACNIDLLSSTAQF